MLALIFLKSFVLLLRQSLEKAFTSDEVMSFFSSVKSDMTDNLVAILAEPKIDGLSLSLQYANGHLIRAVTRGNGSVGDDVTENAKTIESIPKIIDSNDAIEVRGEVFMKKSVFKELNALREASGDEPFANPRNAAAGSLKLKDPSEVAKRKLSFIAYQIFGTKDESQFDKLATISSFGFFAPESLSLNLTSKSVDSAIMAIARMRSDFEFDIDGIVFKVDEVKIQEELGKGSSTPKWAVAYKFPAERAVSKLKTITLTVGRTGQITPNANIEPIRLAGTVVENASLAIS